MALKDFDIDSINAPETKIARAIRAQLRLSSNWKVVGMKTKPYGSEFSEEYPELREAVHVDDLEESSLGTVQYLISQELKDTYRCPCCCRSAKAVSYHVRILNHITDKGHECQLVVNIPKLRCDGCKGTPRVRFPAADERKGYTRQLKRAVITALKTKSRTSAAKEFNLHWGTVENILADTIGKAIPEQDLSHVTGVFVDETQFGHGHDYITTFLDQKHKVIFICRGHGSEALSLFRDHLIIQGGDPESIRFFSADMSPAYESGILSEFPNAVLIWDRFHLAKAVNDAINDIRKQLVKRGKTESLGLVKYTVLTRERNLSRTQAERLRDIRFNNPEMALAYDMKEVFLEIIKQRDAGSMERSLRIWMDWVELNGHRILKKKAERFREKMDRIMAWTRFPVSNSVSEGVNKNIQDIRRQACGCVNLGSFVNMILLRQGDLTFRF